MRPDRLLRHPLVVLPLVAGLLAAAWLGYADARVSVSRPAPGTDLLAAVRPAAHAATGGWRVGHSLDATASLTAVPGRFGAQALQVDVTHHASGDVTLTSPRVPVGTGRDHLFKAYVTNGPAFTLLARYLAADGTAELVEVAHHAADRGPGSTVAAAFHAGGDLVAVQYVLRLAGTGRLTVDGAYLAPADDVQVPVQRPAGRNLLPGGEHWTPYVSGSATTEFERQGTAVVLRTTGYRDGEAKWQYPPVPVEPDRYYRFTADYTADREVELVAEFELADGTRRFQLLRALPPAGQWTVLTEHVQVPPGATTLLVTLIAHGDGRTQLRDADLADATRPGPLRWSAPRVSVTVDDGRASAADVAAPLLAGHGYRGTFYVNPSTVETPGFVTAADLAALARAGHDVAAHGMDDVDLTALGADRLDGQLRGARDALAAAGFPTEHLATPLGRSDPQVEQHARRWFSTVRGMTTGINTRQDLDPFDLKVFFVDARTTPADLAAALERTRELNGWLVLVYHRIDDDPGDRTTVRPADFARHLAAIERSGIAVEPVAQAFAAVRTP